jgi:outer membrane immunogenic protein
MRRTFWANCASYAIDDEKADRHSTIETCETKRGAAMNRTVTLGLGALALAGMTFSASAADIARPVTKEPPVVAPPVIYNWSGFYIGAHIGGAWGDKDWTDVTFLTPFAEGSHDVSGFLAGGQIGFNWQFGAWVFGVEGQASWTNADGSHPCLLTVGFDCTTEMNFLGTVAGRIGYAFDRVLLYVKGGAAFVSEDFFQVATVGPVILAGTTDETRTGWMVGAGLEWALWDNWSAKIEYNFMDFGTERVNLITITGGVFSVTDIDQQVHVVKAGINYRFSWGKAPVAARY